MMKKVKTRNYNCKDEELPVICKNASTYLKRDLADFYVFSPVFDMNYVNVFETKIDSIDELVLPKIETEEVKKITKRLYYYGRFVRPDCQDSRISTKILYLCAEI
jgi:hypothetical protein